jgi:beta-galactosidase
MLVQRIAPQLLVVFVVLLGRSHPAAAERTIVPLDGKWSIAESVGAEEIPARFDHTVAVPGLANQAKPAFPDVDQYETHEFVWTMKQEHVKLMPSSEKCEGLGRTRQKRNYFWYERTFAAPARRQSAVLVINKAQFGTAVWLNGKKVGERLGCFTAGRFDVADALNWSGENRLMVRIGAHPGALPDSALYGTDGEKSVWTPGIYDSVSLLLADNPAIESLQVAPRIDKSEIVVQTRLKNRGPACSFDMTYRVTTWKGSQAVGEPVRQRVELAAGEEKLILQTVPVPGAVLWSPDNPFLYVLDTSSGGDSCSTRFGMREFRCDSSTSRAMLNGKVVYLRGASITLHRFFGDPKCGGLPWDEAWVRKFLVEIPRQMHWNAFRICIGPVPQQWLDVADEAGLLLQYEFPIWSDRECLSNGLLRHKLWKEEEVTEQVREFMRDNWNHPSVVIWDASNETKWDFLREKLVPAVRGLDLSNRPWDNGYNAPQDANDPCEYHPYRFADRFLPGGELPFFQMTDLEKMNGAERIPFATHAAIINEYDWLWLHRDGMPTFLSQRVFDSLLGPKAAPAERFELSAYLLAGLTEFHRAHRKNAGVMYLAYLDADRPIPYLATCDTLRDVEKLQLEPRFADYMGEAFNPLGVYVNFWQPKLAAGAERSYRVMLVNDTYEPAGGKLELVWQLDSSDRAAGSNQRDFEVPALGQATYDVILATPAVVGRYTLTAKAYWAGKPWSPTIARRKVAVEPTGGN